MGGGSSPLKSNSYNQKASKSFLKILLSKIDFKNQSRGAILIEFAFCTPILILLIYYMHDLFKIQRYYSQTEFVAYQMVQMMQTVSQNRKNKKLSSQDLRYIFAAAWQTVYPAETMHYKENAYDNGGYFFAHAPYMWIYYVKGLDNGNASCVWRCAIAIYDNKFTTPSNLYCPVYKDGHPGSTINYKTDVTPALIYPKLTIKPGEAKIIVETSMIHQNKNNSNVNKRGLSAKQAMGLYMSIPPYKSAYGYDWLFHSVVIFSPNPGLFDENGPE